MKKTESVFNKKAKFESQRKASSSLSQTLLTCCDGPNENPSAERNGAFSRVKKSLAVASPQPRAAKAPSI